MSSPPSQHAPPAASPSEAIDEAAAHADREQALALSLRSGLPFTGLRGFEPDRRLFAYLPLSLAVAESLLPLVLVGDALKVASATPDPDLSLLIQRFPYVTVDIVIASRAEIQSVLARVGGEVETNNT